MHLIQTVRSQHELQLVARERKREGAIMTRSPMKQPTAGFLFLALLMGLLLLAGGTVSAQDSITTLAHNTSNPKFDGIAVAVGPADNVYTTADVVVSKKLFVDVFKLDASASPLLVEGSQSDPNPPYGTGVCGQSATNIDPTDIGGVAVDNSGTFYTAMAGGYPPVLRISSGIVSCLEWGTSGPQSSQDVTLDNSGNVYFISQDSVGHYFVYKVPSQGAGTPTVVAGTANFGCSVGTLNHPYGLALDNRTGNLYIADAGCNVIWKVTAAGITAYAGNFIANSDPTSPAGDGGVATNAYLNEPRGVAVDPYGNLYIADFADNRIRKVDFTTNIITTIAGNGTAGLVDNADATKAELSGPWGIAVGPGGKIYVGDSANNAVRLITPPGAQMTSPPPGSTLPAEPMTFTWTAVSGATSYQLDVSQTIGPIGQGNIVGSATGTISGTSLQTDVPCDGKTIYVQLATEIGGAWTAPVQYTYTACQIYVSIGLSSPTLPKQGGTVSVRVAVNTLPMAYSEVVELKVTQYRVPAWPCINSGCPAPVVIGTASLPWDPWTTKSSYEVTVPSLPSWDPYEQAYLFTATVSSPSLEVLNTASVRLIQY